MIINNDEVKYSVQDGIDTYEYGAFTSNDGFWDKVLNEHLGSECVDSASMLVMELTHCYNACVQSIGCDMWFGVSISAGYGTWQGDEFVYEKQCDVYVQCDMISHGLLAAVMILKELGYENHMSSGF